MDKNLKVFDKVSSLFIYFFQYSTPLEFFLLIHLIYRERERENKTLKPTGRHRKPVSHLLKQFKKRVAVS
jgi:hypothetical protein